MNPVKPERLKEGDTILIVAPSSSMSGISSEAVKLGIYNLKSMGFKVKISPHGNNSYKGTAGPSDKRAQILMDAFQDEKINGIMCFWGGFNCNDILQLMDWDTLRENPKVFIGYSDITVLNTTLYEKAGMINFQGPAFITFTHEFLMSWEKRVFKQVLMNPTDIMEITPSPTYIDDPLYFMHPYTPVIEQQNRGWRIIREGTANGKLIGGHIGSLLGLAGTEYWPCMKDKLLFLEEDEESNARLIRRMFRQLDQMDVFEDINGLLIGRIPEVVGLRGEVRLSNLIEDVIESYDFPVVANMDFGHTNPIMTIPVGIQAEIDSEKSTLTYLEAGVR